MFLVLVSTGRKFRSMPALLVGRSTTMTPSGTTPDSARTCLMRAQQSHMSLQREQHGVVKSRLTLSGFRSARFAASHARSPECDTVGCGAGHAAK